MSCQLLGPSCEASFLGSKDLVVCLDCRSAGRLLPAGEQDNSGEAGARSGRWGYHVDDPSFLARAVALPAAPKRHVSDKRHATGLLDCLGVPRRSDTSPRRAMMRRRRDPNRYEETYTRAVTLRGHGALAHEDWLRGCHWAFEEHRTRESSGRGSSPAVIADWDAVRRRRIAARLREGDRRGLRP